MCACKCTTVHMWRSEDNLCELSSLLLPCKTWASASCHQIWQKCLYTPSLTQVLTLDQYGPHTGQFIHNILKQRGSISLRCHWPSFFHTGGGQESWKSPVALRHFLKARPAPASTCEGILQLGKGSCGNWTAIWNGV